MRTDTLAVPQVSLSSRPAGTTEIRAGLVLLIVLAAAAWLGPWLLHISPFERSLDLLAPPSASHWLGTDEEGCDVLAKVLHGGRLALLVGPGVAVLSAAIGLVLGAPAGYFGGLLDRSVLRLADTLMAFPGVLLALLLVYVSPAPGVLTVVLALGLSGWAGHARLVRMLVASAREREFVVAARCLGASHPRILLVHVLPEVVGPVAVQATLGVAAGVLGEASLSFLGLGPQGVVSWGAMLEQGAVLFLQAPAIALSAGGGLALLLTSLNLIGDGLRDRLDPRAARQT
jgi:peptide/nickel transport system permease protein